jgi:CHASE2 domain-containing sensor protein
VTLREGARTVLAFGLVAFVLAHAAIRTCWRGGCYRTFFAGLVSATFASGAAAALVRGVEGVVSVAAALALLGYGVSRVRARLR